MRAFPEPTPIKTLLHRFGQEAKNQEAVIHHKDSQEIMDILHRSRELGDPRADSYML